MKTTRLVSIFISFLLLLVIVLPAYAQLGDTGASSFTVQNLTNSDVVVTVTFYDSSGSPTTPSQLDGNTPTTFPNPFTLSARQARQVYVPNIPAAQLPPGEYSVVISSTGLIAAVSGIAGNGSIRFSGTYAGFSSSGTTAYLPSVVHDSSGFYSMISIMNVSSSPADVTVNIICTDSTTGTLSANDIPAMSSHTFDLTAETPTGFTSSTDCEGSAVITSDYDIVVIDNQNDPTNGRTYSYSGSSTGSPTIYIPELTNDYFGWDSKLVIRKIGSGSTTVTIDYSDSEPNDTCNLTDAMPFCSLNMDVVHPTTGIFGAKITSSSNDLVVMAGILKPSTNAAGAYSGAPGANSVEIPEVTKEYFGWNSSVTCQNVTGSAADTTLKLEYSGHSAYDDTEVLSDGEIIQYYVPNETFLNNGYIGGLKVTANNSSALISCIVGNNNPSKLSVTPGDWALVFIAK